MLGCLDPDFWRGKRVFLTGHTGFKGAWLAYWLIGLGAKVTGYALKPATSPALFELLKLDELVENIFGDIRDAKKLRASIEHASPEIVLHLAAQPIVSVGYNSPTETFETNVMGVVHLLDACRHLRSQVPILIISSVIAAFSCCLNRIKGFIYFFHFKSRFVQGILFFAYNLILKFQ